MPGSRSRRHSAYRRQHLKNILLFSLLGLFTLTLVVMAGRFAYLKSKNPQFTLKEFLGVTTSALPTLPAPTLETSEEATSGESLSETGEMAMSSASSEDSLPVPTTSGETTAEESTQPADSSETTDSSETGDSRAAETSQEASSEEETGESSLETEPETSSEVYVSGDPLELSYHLNNTGMTEEELDCSQLIVVQSSGSDCRLYFFEKDEDGWALRQSPNYTTGTLGRQGVIAADLKREGDDHTPAGYYALGPCLGESAKALNDMEYYQITSQTYWVDDGNSKYYNKLWLSSYGDKDWNSAEDLGNMLHYYKYSVFIQYNSDPAVPGMGSAIFLHVKVVDGTSGCIATSQATMNSIMYWLKAAANPHILIY